MFEQLRPITKKLPLLKELRKMANNRLNEEQLLLILVLTGCLLVYILPVGTLISNLLLLLIVIQYTSVHPKESLVIYQIFCLMMVSDPLIRIIPLFNIVKIILMVIIIGNDELKKQIEQYFNLFIEKVNKVSVMDRAKQAVDTVKEKYDKSASENMKSAVKETVKKTVEQTRKEMKEGFHSLNQDK